MKQTTQAERADVYTRITAEIVAAIEAGAGDWRMGAPPVLPTMLVSVSA